MAKLFKDTEGREWIVTINVATVKRLKVKLELDLLDQLGIKLLERVAEDPIQLADVLFVVCEAECEKRELDDVAFGSALSGDVLEEAGQALMQAIADFFPTARRQVIAKALSKMKEVEAKAGARAIALLESDLMEQAMDKNFREAETKFKAGYGLSSTTAPAS